MLQISLTQFCHFLVNLPTILTRHKKSEENIMDRDDL